MQEALRAYVEEMAPVPRLRPDASSAQKRILVAIDDSESAGWALQVAGELAQALSARLALLHVVRPVLGFGRDFMAANRLDLSRRQEAAEWLHRMQRRLSPAITSECMLKTGSPAEQILAEQVVAQATPQHLMGQTPFVSALNGEELGLSVTNGPRDPAHVPSSPSGGRGLTLALACANLDEIHREAVAGRIVDLDSHLQLPFTELGKFFGAAAGLRVSILTSVTSSLVSSERCPWRLR